MSFSEAWQECGGDFTCASPECRLISQLHVALAAPGLRESNRGGDGALVSEPLKEVEGVHVPWTHKGTEGGEPGFQQTPSLPYPNYSPWLPGAAVRMAWVPIPVGAAGNLHPRHGPLQLLYPLTHPLL